VLGNPVVVEALVTQDGASWQLASLVRTPGTDVWTRKITLGSAADADSFFDAVNSFGRVAYTTDKGALFRSIPAGDANALLGVHIDSTADGAVYLVNQSVKALYGCTGPFVVSCSGPVPNGGTVDTSTIGEHEFTVTAENVNGFQVSQTNTYFVGYRFSGLLPPILSPPTFNSVRAGSTVPLRFSLGGNQGLDIFANDFPKSRDVNCATGAGNGGFEIVPPGSSTLSYDPRTGEYQLGWQTLSSWAGTCRELVVRFKDGTTATAWFAFKKK
jgi:hypothetical protein